MVGPMMHPGLHAHRGIAAGSTFAATELSVLMLPAIAEHKICHRFVTLSIHVDDISMTASGKREQVVNRMISSAEHMFQQIQINLGMPIDIDDKGYILGSSPQVIDEIVSGLHGIAGNKAETVKKLGVDFTLNNTKDKPTLRKRIRSAKMRTTRL